MAKRPVWLVDGAKLCELREQKGWSQQQLADASGVARRSISNFESGKNRTYLHIVKALAQALGVKPEDIARPEKAARVLSDDAKAVSGEPPAAERNRSELERAVDLERATAPDAEIEFGGGRHARFLARTLSNLFNAVGLHVGKRFVFEGTVVNQRGSTQAEAAVLNGKKALTGRFQLRREVAPGVPLSVTVFASGERLCAALQQHYETGKPLRVLVRVVMVEFNDGTMHVPGLSQPMPIDVDGSGVFKGFSGWAVRIAHAWTLLVEDVESQSAPKRKVPQRKSEPTAK